VVLNPPPNLENRPALLRDHIGSFISSAKINFPNEVYALFFACSFSLISII